MKLKKFFVGGLILSAIFINAPNALADDVEVFGDEFSDDPIENVEIEIIEVGDDNFDDDLNFDEETPQPEEIQPEQPEQPPVETPPVEIVPVETPPVEVEPVETPPEIPTVEMPVEIPAEEPVAEMPVEVEPAETYQPRQSLNYRQRQEEIERLQREQRREERRLKLEKLRFVKLTMDENYIYYLDKESVVWRRLPYSASEMIADVWIRMIERNDTDLLPEEEVPEIVFAHDNGRRFRPTDVEVLRHRRYHLEHYYLRPERRQIQFLCELSDIEGRPQNTITEREYNYNNWENLIPDSIETKIYRAVTKVIGTKRANVNNPASLVDTIEEYARISLR